MQFLGKNGQNNRLVPSHLAWDFAWGWHPRLGNSGSITEIIDISAEADPGF